MSDATSSRHLLTFPKAWCRGSRTILHLRVLKSLSPKEERRISNHCKKPLACRRWCFIGVGKLCLALCRALVVGAGESSRLREDVFHEISAELNSKAMSHAVVCPGSIYPRVLVSRGHLMDSMGISIRRVDKKGKAKTQMELLPEEALYLLERGSLQIWSVPYLEQENAEGQGLLMGEWDDAEHGVKGGVEMSVSEGFAVYIGRDGLTWERYQVSQGFLSLDIVFYDLYYALAGVRLSQEIGIYGASVSAFHSGSLSGNNITAIQRTWQGRPYGESMPALQDMVAQHS